MVKIFLTQNYFFSDELYTQALGGKTKELKSGMCHHDNKSLQGYQWIFNERREHPNTAEYEAAGP